MVGIPVGMLAGVTRSKWPDQIFMQRAGAIRFLNSERGNAHCSFRSRWGGWVSGRLTWHEVKPVTGFAIIDTGFQISRGVMKW